jgi:large subunit ribosomal protein L3
MPRTATTLVAIPLSEHFLLPRSTTILQANTSQRRSFGIRSLSKPRHDKYHPKELLASQKAANQRKILSNTLPLRTGACALKKGMTAVYDSEGKRIPATVLQFNQNQVVHHKTEEIHGYYAVCVGSGVKAAKNVTKPLLGHFSAQGVSPKRTLHEFRIRDERGLLPVGQLIDPSWFQPGQFVDTRSVCKGKGWQGVMKRWGMHGQDRSHGVSKTHRSMGSAGQGQGGGSRVYPGKKMAGNMGNRQNTIQNLKVLQSDPERGILVVQGKAAIEMKILCANEIRRCGQRAQELRCLHSRCPEERLP